MCKRPKWMNFSPTLLYSHPKIEHLLQKSGYNILPQPRWIPRFLKLQNVNVEKKFSLILGFRCFSCLEKMNIQIPCIMVTLIL